MQEEIPSLAGSPANLELAETAKEGPGADLSSCLSSRLAALIMILLWLCDTGRPLRPRADIAQ